MIPETARTASVRKTLRVKAPIEFAFRTLSQRMGSWWPATHRIGKNPFTEIVVEAKAGGRWFERDALGVECDWGHVLVWEPPKQVAVSWHLQTDFKYDPDPAKASEVSFELFEEGPEATRIEFEHRHLDRHGAGWEKLRDSVDGGWSEILASYEKLLAADRGKSN